MLVVQVSILNDGHSAQQTTSGLLIRRGPDYPRSIIIEDPEISFFFSHEHKKWRATLEVVEFLLVIPNQSEEAFDEATKKVFF